MYVNGTSAGRREIIIRLKVIKSELRFPPSRDYCCMFSRCTASPLDFLFEIEIVSLTVGMNKQANPSPVDRGAEVSTLHFECKSHNSYSIDIDVFKNSLIPACSFVVSTIATKA